MYLMFFAPMVYRSKLLRVPLLRLHELAEQNSDHGLTQTMNSEFGWMQVFTV